MKKTMIKMAMMALLLGIGAAEVNADTKPSVIPKDPNIILDNSEFESNVPKYSFPKTLRMQEKALAENPLLQRMKKSRLTEYEHEAKFRPDYHFSPAEGGMGDPNGFCYWKGNYHLFYQAFPPESFESKWYNVHWGHAISKDMVHWKDLPYAIYPNPEESCFSGSALVDGDRVIAAYHGTQVGNMIAVSDDPLLLNWEKIEGTAVMPNRTSGVRIFDPCIWKKDGKYYSLSGVFEIDELTGSRRMVQYLFESENLKDWAYLHPFLEHDVFTPLGEDGACPYFWPLGDKYVLIHFSHDAGPTALVGDYDKERDKFVVLNSVRLSSGFAGGGGTHAPSAFPDGDGNVILIMNMSTAKATTYREHTIMGHVMTLPMKLTQQDHAQTGFNVDIGFEPVEQVENLRGEMLAEIANLPLPRGEEVVLEKISGDAIEIEAEVEAPRTFELNVLRSPDGEQVTRIMFYRDGGKRDLRRDKAWHQDKTIKTGFDSLISIDTTQSTALPNVHPRAQEIVPVFLDAGEPVKLRVFVDKSIVEVFVNGKAYVSMRVYPDREDSLGVSLKSHRTDAKLKKLTAWKMKNIWQTPEE